MNLLFAITTGILFAAGSYMILRRNVSKLIFGVVLLSHAANLLVFSVAGLHRGSSPVIPEGQSALSAPHPDPLPQALVLTAIVIGFGVQAFAIVLVKRAYQAAKSDDFDTMDTTEQ